MSILAAGGNAADAAVAVAFTLAVTFPEAGNIGGGGFATVLMDGKAYFLDYRETAPGRARVDMYVNTAGDVIPGASTIGAGAAGVPGTVAGLWELHRRFGRLPWQTDLAPAIRYADRGSWSVQSSWSTVTIDRPNFAGVRTSNAILVS